MEADMPLAQKKPEPGFLGQLMKPRRVGEMSPLGRAVVYGTLGFWSLVVLFPLYWLLVTSFKLPIHISNGPVYLPFVDFQPELHAWREILFENAGATWLAFKNSVIVTSAATALCAVIGSAAAYAIARIEFKPKIGTIITFVVVLFGASIAVAPGGVPWRIALPSGLVIFFLAARGLQRHFRRTVGNRDILFWMISQRILPPVVTILPVYLLFQQLSLLDTQIALVITFTVVNLPIVVWLMHDFFAGIPVELEESAQLDGASRYLIFREIIVPIARSGLAATSLLVLILCWNEYLMALFLSAIKAQTLPILVAAMNTGERGIFWWNMSAVIIVMITPVILMAFFLQRFISKGFLIGAIKG
jgi:multiple sugar transport system permease protein